MTRPHFIPSVYVALFSVALLSPALVAAHAQAPRLLRLPALSSDLIAFRHADDIWTVPRTGGDAERLTSTANIVDGPYFSPDGRMLAYSANVAGNKDVYLIPSSGGTARRITFHPAGNDVIGWTPDGRALLVISDQTSFNDFARLFLIRIDGNGLPQPVPLPSVDQASYSGDGSHVAYTPLNQWQAASWKRYRGGQTEPIWLVDLKSFDLEKIPRDNSNDRFPLWVGDTVYFLSDRNGPISLFSYNVKAKNVEQLIENRGLDFKSAAAGPGGIIYEQFGQIHLYDTATHTEHAININIRGDLPQLAPHMLKVRTDEIQNAALSPTGARAVMEAHGEIFTLPAEKGDVRNLTNTSNAAERDPAWSPDGRRIAYFSDVSGEYQLFIRDQDGLAAPQVINLEPSFYYAPHWSPDSKRILFGDKRLNLWYVDADGGKPIKVDTDNYEGFSGPNLDASFSPDGKWILYLKTLPSLLHAAYLYSLDSRATTQITDGASDVNNPVFDPGGKYAYFTASTDIGPAIDEFNLSSLNRTTTSSVYVAVLSKDLPSPIPPESDDEKSDKEKAEKADKDKAEKEKADKEKADKDKTDKEKADKKEPAKLPVVKVDLENIQQRILALPIPARNYVALRAGKEGVLLIGEGGPAAQSSTDDGPPTLRSLWRFTLEKRQTEEVLRGLGAFDVSFNGEKLLYHKGNGWLIAGFDELKPGAGDASPGKALHLDGMETTVDPRSEWQQMYHETWRIERDFLYDPHAHGLDLKKAEARYLPYVAGLASRSDLTYLQNEMLGEVTIGHMFIRQPHGGPPAPKTGLLGADYTVDHDRYRFAHILSGGNWNPALQAPLTQPGVNVHTGEYLLAVNGRQLHAADNIYSFFEGLAGRQVTIEVGPNPDGAGSRQVVVVPVDSEHSMRQLEWIEDNIRKVDAMTNGQVAYVYLPNTGGAGFNNFNRYFFSQTHKKAVVVDERYNEGGLIADYVIDTLKRVPMANYETREGGNVTEPSGAIFGPKVMIINQSAGSGGDAMPWYFRKAKLGPLVGTRTWGGLVGIGGYPPLVDGGAITAPRTAIFGLEGQWEVENRGIAPDVEVEYDPKSVAAGHDPQLERAVAIVLEQLKLHPPVTYPAPPYPNYHQNDDLGIH